MKNRNKDIIQLISICIIIILVNIIGSMVYHRFDLTHEGRYSLSKATKKLIGIFVISEHCSNVSPLEDLTLFN